MEAIALSDPVLAADFARFVAGDREPAPGETSTLPAPPEEPDAETWGLGPDAEAGLQGMLRLAGGG